MKIKKIAAAVIAAAVLVTTVSLPGILPNITNVVNAADTVIDGDYEYQVNEDEETVTITKYNGTDAEVDIPSVLGGKTVTQIGSDSFIDNNSLISVTFPNSITYIGAQAFDFCKSLISVTIPDSVTYIGIRAFGECSSLEEIIVGKDNAYFSSIDGVLFDKEETELICYPAGKKDTTYIIPNSVTSIYGDAFRGCTFITDVIIPNSVTKIYWHAFALCSSLTNVKIPDSVTELGEAVFQWCTSLTEVELPKSIEKIGFRTFLQCTSLISVTIPESLTEIGDGSFVYCSSLKEIVVDENNANYTDVDGVLFNKDQTELICFPAGKDDTKSYQIPESVTKIDDNAFCDCDSLEYIAIPNSVTELGRYTFENCSSLRNIEIPDSITTISYSTFTECGSLSSVTIPKSVIKIDDFAFWLCDSLDFVHYGGTIADWEAIEIGERNECLTNAEIICTDGIINERKPTDEELNPGDSFVDGILEYKVLEDGTLEVKGFVSDELKETVEELIIPDEVKGKAVTSIGEYSFYDCKCTSITIPNSATSIEKFAFIGSKFISITIPDSVISIGAGAFSICGNLESVMIPNNVTSIGEAAFGGCYSLKEISVDEINKSFSSVDGVLFDKSKTKLVCYPAGKDTSYNIPSGVAEISNSAFDYCSNLTSLTIPDSVTSIGSGAFWGCDSLETLTIPNGVTIINNYTFWSCSSLKTLTIPESVTRIDPAFEHCDALTDVYFGGSKSQWEKVDIYDSVVNDPLVNATIHFAKEDEPNQSETEETEPDVSTEPEPAITTTPEREPEPEVTTIPEPEVTTIPKPEVTTISEPVVTTMPEPVVTTLLEPVVTTIPEPEITTEVTTAPDNEVTTEPDTSDKYDITADVEIPPEGNNVPEGDQVKTIVINAFNMKGKGEIDLSDVKIKAQAIYDEEGLRRAEEALGTVLDGNTHYNLLDLTLLYKGEDFSNGYEGLIQVRFKIPDGHKNKTFSCYRLTEVDGKMVKELIPGTQEDGYYIIYLEHFSLYALVGDGNNNGDNSGNNNNNGNNSSNNNSQAVSPNPSTGVASTAILGTAVVISAVVTIIFKKKK